MYNTTYTYSNSKGVPDKTPNMNLDKTTINPESSLFGILFHLQLFQTPGHQGSEGHDPITIPTWPLPSLAAPPLHLLSTISTVSSYRTFTL